MFKEDFNYIPETYYYPNDKDIIQNKFGNYEFDNMEEVEYLYLNH